VSSSVLTGKPKWIRYRFKTYETADPRPLSFNPRYPWWLSGTNDRTCTIVMWLPETERLTRYYDDAFDIESTVHESIEFTGRFSKPDYYID
jgi:hypothetical protein